MLVGQMAGVGGMLVGQMVGEGRAVCWSVKRLG